MKHNILSKILALALVCVIAAGSAPAAFASDAELTRAEAADMLVSAGDDYGRSEERRVGKECLFEFCYRGGAGD